MDNFIPNYRPIKSLGEFLDYSTSVDYQENIYNYELRHLNESLSTLAFTWRSFVIHIEDLRTSSSWKIRCSLDKVPEFIAGNPSSKRSKDNKETNAIAVLNFLIAKGGVFIMLPPQFRKEETNA